MKYLLTALFVLFGLTARAQNTIIERPNSTTNSRPSGTTRTGGKRTISRNGRTNIKSTRPKQKINASYSHGVLTVNGVRYEMARVVAGTFNMGATSEMQNPDSDEKPTHQVTLTRNYYLGKTEVTQALWQAVMGTTPSNFKGDNRPVECVSWDDCQTFISKLNVATGKAFRLPTETEWEFAARGGNNSRHYQYSGSDDINAVAWFNGNSEQQTHNVGTKQAND